MTLRTLTLAIVALFAFVLPASAATKPVVVKSPDGIEAWLVEDHGLPALAMSVGFVGGSTRESKGKEGEGTLLGMMLDEGAGQYNDRAFKQQLADRSISLSFSCDRDAFYIGLTTLTENRSDAFRLMALALAKPRFDAQSLVRAKDQLRVAQRQVDDDPESLASELWYATAFPNHPYGNPLYGTPQSIGKLTRADLQAAMKAMMTRDRMRVVVVGDIDAETLASTLDNLFASLPAKGQPLVAPPQMAPATLKVIERNNPQTAAVFGLPGLARSDPDFMAAYIVNYVLGGGSFSSRLMDEVREKRGLVYGISTGLDPFFIGGGDLEGSFGTKNETAGQALDLTRSVMQNLVAKGITAKELADAKTYLTGSFALRFDTNAKIARQLLTFALQDQPPEYVENRNKEVEAVTLADVNRAAKRLLDPKRLVVLMVGKPQGVKP
ncbi:MAG: insulinase family protein [Alphaproteobacteria bacterium]|nr:insulinase family protein [Alphaproteobacteria bacterium]